jgi:hypothetical protein
MAAVSIRRTDQALRAVAPVNLIWGILTFRRGARTMRTAIICGALMALTISASAGEAPRNPANDWLPGCKAFIGEGRQTSSSGYCAGIVDALAARAVRPFLTQNSHLAPVPH